MADMEGPADGVEQLIHALSRSLNCLAEDNRITRKKAIQEITKDTVGRKPSLEGDVLQGVLREILKPCLKLVSDPVEKCRELSIEFLTRSMKNTSNAAEFLPYIIPVFVQRLGQQDIVEPSEEIRLTMIMLLSELIHLVGKKIGAFVDDMVKILQRTIVDAYPEVKKESCKCAALLAKTTPENFHMQSESLIKPLLTSLTHQHSKVRVAVVEAIGDVIQYGNGKSVDDVVSHLAQRMFDQAPTVRAAVTKVVGHWLLDLMDRYSFHHKLIPLLLTSLTDEVEEIRTQADGLWHDIGIKYEGENEDDLKDKQDFVKPDPEHYPKGVERPNLGCRTLVYRNFSKIIGGLLRDLGDWVAATRNKCAQLLFSLIVNDEENVTQHLEKVLTGMFRACTDDEKEVVEYMVKSAELIGYFVSPDVWVKMVLESVKTSQSFNTLMILAAVIRGSERGALRPYLEDIVNVISDPAIRTLADGAVQTQLLRCVTSLLDLMQEESLNVGYGLFVTVVSVLALHRSDAILEEAQHTLEKTAVTCSMENKQDLYSKYTGQLIDSLQDDYVSWTQHSVDRLIFDTLLMESGPVVGEILERVVPMLESNLRPEKDAEVRLKMFSLLSRLLMNAPATVDSHQRFGDFVVRVVRDMVLPNLVWRAGRVAAAIRTTAVSCLWALLQSSVFTVDKLVTVQEELLTQLHHVLEDDNRQTRLVACRVLNHLFVLAGTSFDRDRLHNLYPDLLKRMDDSSDDVRVAVTVALKAYFRCFGQQYDVALYKAHLEAIYRGMLVHLDDPEPRIQERVLESLQESAVLCPSLLLDEIEAVRLKHRSTAFLDRLTDHVKSLPKHD